MIKSKNISFRKFPWIIFDFDGVLGRYPGYFNPNYDDLNIFIKQLEVFNKRGFKFGLLTNRSVVEIQPLASFLGITGWILGENGAVALNVEDRRFPIIIHPNYRTYNTKIRPIIIERLLNSGLVTS